MWWVWVILLTVMKRLMSAQIFRKDLKRNV